MLHPWEADDMGIFIWISDLFWSLEEDFLGGKHIADSFCILPQTIEINVNLDYPVLRFVDLAKPFTYQIRSCNTFQHQ